MFYENLQKVQHKIKKATVNRRASSVNPISKEVNKKGIFAAVCLLTVIVLGAAIAGFGSEKSIVYANFVEGLGAGIYWDQTCTNRTLSLEWGTVEAGSNCTFTVYVKNECNSAASLSLETSTWTPTTTLNYMSLNWNYSGQVLSANQVIPLQLTLTVYPTIRGVTNFSFDTTIATTEQ